MRILLIIVCALFVATGMAEAKMKSPVADGPYVVYYASGVIQREEHYKNTDLDGIVKDYYENGKLKVEAVYAAGLRAGEARTYYESGVSRSVGVYKNNLQEGVFKTYDVNGRLAKEEMYVKGVLNGTTTLYYASGAVKKQMFYKNAVLDGTAVEYDEEGKPTATESYRDGILDNRQVYNTANKLTAGKSKPAAPKAKAADKEVKKDTAVEPKK